VPHAERPPRLRDGREDMTHAARGRQGIV
jgi:hypothetical protein